MPPNTGEQQSFWRHMHMLVDRMISGWQTAGANRLSEGPFLLPEWPRSLRLSSALELLHETRGAVHVLLWRLRTRRWSPAVLGRHPELHPGREEIKNSKWVFRYFCIGEPSACMDARAIATCGVAASRPHSLAATYSLSS